MRTKNNNENQKEEYIWELVKVVVERSEVLWDDEVWEDISIYISVEHYYIGLQW